ncbi:capsid protein [Oleomonas cavernae]|uniref:Capsid protein n=1 Tax=Oleomonas cavernae TaxID=2320859 RepID=A0A418WUI8_9PROT|nr:capsid protein [Oleomonas cavernae]RJF94809.1 capsid protein [Oleomonas cavernae]
MTGFPFPVDPELTGVVISYANGDLVADRVLPRISPLLSKQTFEWLKFEFGEQITIPDTTVGRKGEPNEVEFSATEDTSKTIDYGLDDVVPIDDVNNAPVGYNPLSHAAQGVMDLVLLDRERRVANSVFAAATYPVGNKVVLAGTSQWSHASSDPVAAITAAQDALIMRANVLVLGRPTWTALSTNPAILKAVHRNDGDKGIATRQAVADLFELDEIIVGSAFVNTAKKGQALAKARLWGKHAALIRRDGLASNKNGRATFGMTMQYGGKVAGQIPEPKTGLRGSIRVRAGESVKELITAPDLGYFFESAVA